MRWLWVIPAAPLAGAVLNGVILRRRIGHRAVSAVATGSVLVSLLAGLGVIGSYLAGGGAGRGVVWTQTLWDWLPAGGLWTTHLGKRLVDFKLAFQLDGLSAVMVFIVTFVGFWIHVYSVGYMHGETGYQRYFTYLNLFMGAMLLLVLGNNFLVLFVGWEGVGLCSYLLIGFYYDQPFPPQAGRKAFIVNRIGDFAFLVGLFALVSRFGSLDFSTVFSAIAADPAAVHQPYALGLSFAGFVALCLFLGAVGKSAQIPLYVWLPDAMAGPTPVSALIHAATMVTAGVYMVARSHVLYDQAPEILAVVAVIGTATALLAATIGLAQTDIKKVLAYSTVSQLGYMFLAAGCGAYGAAIFHLGTHAFFKALLFLGSGSVIHAMGGEQDMRKMGGLRARLPVTYWTFLIATLAISGIPPLAGFFSKDQILSSAFPAHKVLWGVGLATAGLTALYMFRAVYLTFHGTFRGTEEQAAHVHESPAVMTVPLVVLAIGAVAAGWVGLPKLGGWDWNLIERWLGPGYRHVAKGAAHAAEHAGVGLEAGLMGLSVAVALAGVAIAWRVYGGTRGVEGGAAWAHRFPRLHRMLENKYWVDEAYDATVVRGTWGLARLCRGFDGRVIDGLGVHGARNLTLLASYVSGFFDKYVVDGLVNLIGVVLQALSRLFRRLQGGLVSQYALVMVVGVFMLAFFCVLLLTQ